MVQRHWKLRYERKCAAAICIQAKARMWLLCSKYKAMQAAAVKLQVEVSAAPQQAEKQGHADMTPGCSQLTARESKRLTQFEHVQLLRLQAHWRACSCRRAADPQLVGLRRRLREAAGKAREHPERQLGRCTASAVSKLVHAKHFAEVGPPKICHRSLSVVLW